MSENRISRRAIVPGIAAGATAALAVAATQAAAAPARTRRVTSTAGPCRLWPGHTLAFHIFLPEGARPTTQTSRFSLTLRTIDGQELLTHEFDLQPGKGVELELALDAQGNLHFNGVPVPNAPSFLVVIAIIAILIGLLVPAVQKVRANSTSFVPGRVAGEQNVDYLLPFIEQDN